MCFAVDQIPSQESSSSNERYLALMNRALCLGSSVRFEEFYLDSFGITWNHLESILVEVLR